jgi:hypothetical protein
VTVIAAADSAPADRARADRRCTGKDDVAVLAEVSYYGKSSKQ